VGAVFHTIVADEDRLQGIRCGDELEDDLEDALRPKDRRHLLRSRHRRFSNFNRQRPEGTVTAAAAITIMCSGCHGSGLYLDEHPSLHNDGVVHVKGIEVLVPERDCNEC
jgi:hypothetical protein